MKKFILTAVLVISLVGGQLFAAGEERVGIQARETFKREFPSAEYARWEEINSSGIFMVRFVYENQGFVAYFNEVGAMVASARLVRFENLPYKVSQAFRSKYNDSGIIKIEELTMDGIPSYFFTIENGEAKSLIRVHYDGTMEKVKAEKKKSGNKK
jgi:hypothetical protein